VQDNLAISPSDVASYTITAPSDPRLPNGGGYTVGPLYNINPNKFGQSNLLFKSTKDVGDDTRVFNGVDVNFNVRLRNSFTFSGGTSTGKVENDWCDIRAAVPEVATYIVNPYCHVETPFQTSFRGLASYTIPHIDVLVSTVYQDKINVATDQLVSLQGNYVLTAADLAAAAAQIGRPLTIGAPITVNLLSPGDVYGDRIRQLDLSIKKIMRFGGQRVTAGIDMLNLLNNNVTLAFNQTYVPTTTGWLTPTTYMNPRVFRLSGEFSW